MSTSGSGIERFTGRILGVATIHGKERVIGPELMKVLPLVGFKAIDGVDTDRFGSFSGEVQRTLDPLAACEAKARHGAKISGLDLVIASEGSFGPYTPAPFISCDEEILVLFDARDDRLFHHRLVSLVTVFGGEECASWSQAKAFADRMKFPSHHLVIRTRKKWERGDPLLKGIQEEHFLRSAVDGLLEQHGSCWAETDMRAMANPTRMRAIAQTAERFAAELASTCPKCGACWFRITQALPGLPCEQCGWPTQSVRSYLRTCYGCGYQDVGSRPDGRKTEEPMHCGNCNP